MLIDHTGMVALVAGGGARFETARGIVFLASPGPCHCHPTGAAIDVSEGLSRHV